MSAAEKVRKLAALAASENEHEANAAARQACRLIREGKVSIAEAGRQRPHGQERAWSPWDAWEAPSPPPARRRAAPRGPFARRRDVRGASCAVCGEEIALDDAFACQDGYVHGDCIPAAERP